MLKLTIQLSESYDEDSKEFISQDLNLELEHSLVSLSKWESKFEKPFLGPNEKSTEETLEYIKFMILTPDVPENILELFTTKDIEKIHKYIDAKMSATWFTETKTAKRTSEQITSELIYYWIVSYQIPWEVENWHLNRLFTLIRVFNVKNSKPEKKSAQEIAAERQRLNAQRRQQMGTSG